MLICGVGFAVNQKPGQGAQPLRDAFVLAGIAFAITVWLSHMLLHREGRARLALACLAPIFVAGDLWFGHSEQIQKGMAAVPVTSHDDEVARLEGVPLAARIYDRAYLGFRPGIRLGLRDLAGYEGDPLALSRYQRVIERVKKSPRLLGHLNVGWLLERGDMVLRGNRGGLTTLHRGVSKVTSVAPAVLWADRAAVVDGPDAAATALFAAPAGTIAVVERGWLDPAGEERAQRGDGAAPVVAGRLVELERNRLVAEIEAPADGVVVVSEAFFPGWSARVDGAPAAVFPANAAFRGVLVGPGRHRIEMEYSSGAWPTLALVSLLGFAGAALAAAWPALSARWRGAA